MSRRRGEAFVLAALAFAAGLAAGTAIGPVRATRAQAPAAPPVQAEFSQPAKALYGPHPAEVVRVVDGDTFEARVHLWPGIDVTTKVRLRSIDAPELKARCREELEKAQTAREALAAILAEGDVFVGKIGNDKYGGRVLAEASTRITPDVSQKILAGGYARKYAGGHRDGWCG